MVRKHCKKYLTIILTFAFLSCLTGCGRPSTIQQIMVEFDSYNSMHNDYIKENELTKKYSSKHYNSFVIFDATLENSSDREYYKEGSVGPIKPKEVDNVVLMWQRRLLIHQVIEDCDIYISFWNNTYIEEPNYNSNSFVWDKYQYKRNFSYRDDAFYSKLKRKHEDYPYVYDHFNSYEIIDNNENHILSMFLISHSDNIKIFEKYSDYLLTKSKEAIYE